MKKWLVGLMSVGMLATAAMGQSVVINEFRNATNDAVELVVVTDGLNMQGMILKDHSSSGANDGGGAYIFSSNTLWAAVPAGTIILLQKTNTATDITVGGGDYNLVVGLQNTTYFSAGANSFDISTEEIVQIKASGSGQAGSTGAIHTLATAAAGAQYASAPSPKLKASTGNSGFQMSVEANNATAALSDFDGTGATGGNATGTIGTYNNANNQTYIESLRGPAVFGVTFNKTTGFAVEQGTSDAITATAANGTAPYGYSWSSSLGASYYSTNAAVFTILATAPTGSYSATVVASDSAAQNVTNSLNFSVVPPATKYAIAITPPVNGTVTTTPATEAVAGATVTVNATPAGGYAVNSITVTDADAGNVTVNGTTFTMPAKAVTVTVTFQAFTGSTLFISEVADPSGTGGGEGRFVEFYNAGASSIDLAAGQWFLLRQANGTTMAHIALTGTVNAASTYVIAYSATSFPAAYPLASAPNQVNGNVSGTGDDGYFLYSGGSYATGTLQDAFGVINQDGTGMPWEYTDSRAVRNAGVSAGNPTWTASEWTIASAAYAAMTPGVHPDGAAVFGVTFNKTTGFTVEQGTSDSVTATAANGTAPYSYTWNSTLGSSFYTTNAGVFTILATAPVGGYTSTVVATDSGAQSVTNSIGFSVAAPAPKYAIAIVTNAPANGTVTTTPATEAAAGATVTVNATPAGGYAVDSITVVDADLGGVTVTGTTFTMPAKAVTVTVNFAVSETPDALVDFESYSGSYALTNYVAGGVTWTMTNAYAGNTTDDRKNGAKAARLENNRGGAGNPGRMTSTAFAQGVTKITFWYANFGANDGGKFKVQASSDGSSWQDLGSEYDPASNAALAKATLDSIPAGMTYVQFITTAGSSQRVNIDDIGLFFGAPVLGVTANRTNGFVVAEGSTDSITATAANGTAPYSYSWSSTLGSSYRTTNANVFTILATAPTGSYSATVTATDSTMATAQRTVTFRVVGGNPGDPTVVVSGSLAGTVGVQMSLAITLSNAVAADWYIDLQDPDMIADTSYDFTAPTFLFTPTKVGTYSLTATAVDGGDTPIAAKTVSLTVSAAGGDPVIAPVALALNGTGNFSFAVPSGYALSRVLGADTSLNDKSLVWSNLTANVHYTNTAGNVTILTIPNSRKILRIGVTPSP